ncbi:putative quinone-oxidoreductase homolog, chloroplastic [Ananas comosus]|uniref:Quinone-oxidoreductase homolog, chloroplastic n=1 Tax=Ananas comosus TaxID=4615 RepID=A0A6P5GU25_ANACO|nr:putative quinone-oxidoreductase homolog, chloroplastic [Ananas comosus]
MAGATMRAVQYHGYGGGAAALKHEEVPIPSPKKGEVLIKVEAASINPADWKIQKGFLRPFLPSKFPFIPVTDIAGEIVELGSQVDTFKVGDKVVGMLNFTKGGGLAEYVVAPASLMVLRSPDVSPIEAAGLPMTACTAIQVVKDIGTKFDGTGERLNILITSASGGVGSYAVQLAKLGNHHVTATCGARNVELVKSLGADEVLDYKSPEGAALKSPSGKKYDVIINCAYGLEWSHFKPELSDTGRVLDVAASPKTLLIFLLRKLSFSKKKLSVILVSNVTEKLGFLVELVKEGKLKTVIDSTHSLEKAEEAWAKCLDGHATGKIIVEM